jgi:hypothetical protein
MQIDRQLLSELFNNAVDKFNLASKKGQSNE